MLFTSTTVVVLKIKIPFLISYCYPIDNEILIASVTNGVYRMEILGSEKSKDGTF
jgi:hypothetical protein